MSEGGKRPGVRKSESPEDSLESKVESLESEQENKSEIEIPKSEIQSITTHNSPLTNMEVHHHPHVEKKSFKEYVLEGLMIFLAVFMGFIAENIREHVVEKTREKEYIKEMVNNLKYDTLRCGRNVTVDKNYSRGLDSLRGELKKAIEGKADANKLYYFSIEYSGAMARAVFNSSAYTELKSSGSLRLIGDEKLVSMMSDYYDRRATAAQVAAPTDLAKELKKTDDEFFSLTYFDNLIKGMDKKNAEFKTAYDSRKILSMRPTLKLLDTKPEDLQKLYNEVAEFEIGLKNYIFFMNWAKGSAVSLMESIKKQYSLEDE